MYLKTNIKSECSGCEACGQICPKSAITFVNDDEGFFYPQIDLNLCIHCNLCQKVCPIDDDGIFNRCEKYVFGGYILDKDIKFDSTSGGAFSAIAKAFCDNNYVIFGAEAKGLSVFHSYITDINDISKFRKSKYSQSKIGSSYKKAKQFLLEGKKVIFSGTPCQIAGLKKYLSAINQNSLLMIEVVCEGVPSPLYFSKLQDKLGKRNNTIKYIDYRYKGKSIFGNNKWDFQTMEIATNNRIFRKDRWFNPFWSIWLQHLMSRPSCYECRYAKQERVADITLGDLWGVHLYCPELYGKNGGASLVVCNTEKGKEITKRAEKYMYGHELIFQDALKYQSPLRNHIATNTKRDDFMKDLISNMSYDEINKKWAKSPSLKLLWQKYIWGNRQRIALWNILHGGTKK